MTPEVQQDSKPIAVDLCAGAGGLTLGFENAGFSVVAAVENNPRAAEVHRRNFPRCKVVQDSIIEMKAEAVLTAAKLEPGAIDVVFGGPPCQGFSLIGKRNRQDERSAVLVEFARLAAELQPKVIVAENVSGVLMGWARPRLEEFWATLRGAGYRVLEPWQLNANDHGVPQNRHRVFLVAVREGVSDPVKPEVDPSYVAPTVWEAIGDLVKIAEHPEKIKGHTYTGPLGTASKYVKSLRNEFEQNEPVTCCAVPKHSTAVKERFAATAPGNTEKISRFQRLSPVGASATIRAGTGPENGSFMASRPIHPTLPRCITVREAARLHGFPDSFGFDPEHWHGFRQIGNAVPPPLAEAVARAIVASLKKGNV